MRSWASQYIAFKSVVSMTHYTQVEPISIRAREHCATGWSLVDHTYPYPSLMGLPLPKVLHHVWSHPQLTDSDFTTELSPIATYYNRCRSNAM